MDAAEREAIELADQQEEAAMGAAFSGADLEPETPATEPEPEPAAEPVVPAEPEPAAQPEPKAFTADDVRAIVEEALKAEQAERRKLQDSVYGTIGNLKQKVEAAKPAANTMSPKARENLKAGFPELHEMLFGGMPEPSAEPVVDPVTQQAIQPPPVDIGAIVTSTKDELAREFQSELMDMAHPDWREAVNTPDFGEWKASLSPAAAAELDTTWKAKELAPKIADFKAWKAAKATAEAAKKTAAQEAKERLEAALTPQGVPRQAGSGVDEDDEETAMAKAFNAGRKR